MSAVEKGFIMVRNPGSTNYVRAKVIKVEPSGEGYRVKYENGKEQFVKEKYVKIPRNSPSRASNQSTSPRRLRPRSPGRKSPGRAKSADRKSPGRPKSTDRKSPSRGRPPKEESPEPERSRIVRSPGRKSRVALVAPSLIQEKNEKRTYELQKDIKDIKLKEPVAKDTPVSSKNAETYSFSTITHRRSTRITTSTPKIDDILSEKFHKSSIPKVVEKTTAPQTPYKVVEYIKKPVTPSVKQKHEAKPKESPRWYAGFIPISIFFTYLLIAHLFYSQKMTNLHWNTIPLNWKTYFTIEGFYLPFGFLIFQSILHIIPLGKVVQSTKTINYNFRKNGLLNALLTISGLLVLHIYYKLPTQWVLEHIIPMIITGTILAFFFSLILYIRGSRAQSAHLSTDGNSGRVINDFMFGREVAPRIGKVDIRLLVLRFSCISTVLLNIILILNNKKLRPDFWWDLSFIMACIQTVYYLSYLLIEDYYVTTFDYSKSGTGFLILWAYLITPFSSIILTRSLISTGYSYPWYYLVPIILLFLVGLLIFLLSNIQKAKFRLNPLDTSLTHLNTLPTLSGKKLLVSGWWGWVRHPNYFGDIIISISMSALIGTSDWLPYVIPSLFTLNMLYRVHRVEAHCRGFYGVAWNHYCNRVKHKLIRGVF